jgi:hypothetical protein
MKDKMQGHKGAAKAKAREAKGDAQSMGQDMKAAVPAAPALTTAP